MKPYYSSWDNPADILASFEAPAEALDGAEVLFAAYEGGSYEGDALVIYRKDGKLYEVGGGHCSCYGLEGQWSPDEIVPAQLLMRPELSDYSYAPETREAFAALVKELNK